MYTYTPVAIGGKDFRIVLFIISRRLEVCSLCTERSENRIQCRWLTRTCWYYEAGTRFLRNLMTYHFAKKNLRKSYLADLRKTYENLTTNLGRILGRFENLAPELYELSISSIRSSRSLSFLKLLTEGAVATTDDSLWVKV